MSCTYVSKSLSFKYVHWFNFWSKTLAFKKTSMCFWSTKELSGPFIFVKKSRLSKPMDSNEKLTCQFERALRLRRICYLALDVSSKSIQSVCMVETMTSCHWAVVYHNEHGPQKVKNRFVSIHWKKIRKKILLAVQAIEPSQNILNFLWQELLIRSKRVHVYRTEVSLSECGCIRKMLTKLRGSPKSQTF